MKNIQLLLISILVLGFSQSRLTGQSTTHDSTTNKIQIAFLLDVSGSMSGLIAQAQAQLWTIVNFLSHLQKDGQKPSIEFAVITYGNAGLAEKGHIDVVAPFSTDLDLISDKLFLLSVSGGNEYCGQALQTGLDSLKWSADTSHLRMIVIAGNEPFDQGECNYIPVCDTLARRGLYLNTVYCGGIDEGISFQWENAAIIGQGEYLNIEQDLEIAQIETPYDGKIIDLYQQYKATYLFFGPDHEEKRLRYQNQDHNAYQISNAFYRDRIIYKIQNDQIFDPWDLIDQFDQNSNILDSLDRELLPEHLKILSPKELRRPCIQNQYKRQIITEAIQIYADKVKEFLAVSQKGKEEGKTLDDVLKYVIRKQAIVKGYKGL